MSSRPVLDRDDVKQQADLFAPRERSSGPRLVPVSNAADDEHNGVPLRIPAVDEDQATDNEIDTDDADTERSSTALMVRGDASHKLVEQVKRYFYRLSWRLPGHQARIGGKLPPRILAVPDDSRPGDPVKGSAIRAGHFLHRGRKISFEEGFDPNSSVAPPAREYIHRFDWLRDLDCAANRDQARPVAEALIVQWLDIYGEKPSGAAWNSQVASWRLMNWAAMAPIILASRDLIYRSRVLRHVARLARHLDHSAPKAAKGKPRLIAWCGVVSAALLLPEGGARKLVGEDALAKAIDDAIFPDGGVPSRSPLGLIECLSALAYVRNAYLATDTNVPEFFQDTLNRMVSALLGLTHGDGGLGAWQGSAALSPGCVERVIEATAIRGRPQKQAVDWGYQRVTAGRSVLLVDAAPPPLPSDSDSGCASTLALEFSHGLDRIFVNCGGGALAGAHISSDLAEGLRTTAAHNTLCLADTNSTAIEPDGTLGRGVNEVSLNRDESEAGTVVEAEHDGYARSFGLNHRRRVVLSADGLQLHGTETLLPNGKSRRKGEIPLAVRFHLAPDIEANALDNGRAVVLRLGSGARWHFLSVNASRVYIEESIWIDPDGRPNESQQIVIESSSEAGGNSVSWLLKFME